MTSAEVGTPVRDGLRSDAAGSRRLRILHLNAGNLYGGVETMLTTLASLRDLCPGMEPHFATCYASRSSREIQTAGAALHLLGPAHISRPWTVWRARRRLIEILRGQHFDIVVCHMPWSLAVFGPAVKAAGQKLCFWAHAPYTGSGWLERLARRVTPGFAIANSRFTASSMRQHFPSTSLAVIHCPATLVDAPEAGHWRATLRKDQGIADDTTVILQVSRMEAWKGHLVHLHALSRLPAAQKWVSWIVGGPQTSSEEKYFAQLRETARELGIGGRVQFLGQRSDVPKLLAAADIFCQPNQGPEPFGLVFVEALWAGRPVITSNIGGAVEIIDESCGLLVNPGDADSLVQSLDTLIESADLRARLGAAGVERARSLCDPASQMKKLHGLMQSEIGAARV